MGSMECIDQVPRAKLARLRGVLTDIDDTITAGGKLRPQAYRALWRLHEAGLLVVPVTGRPAGWCDVSDLRTPSGQGTTAA